MLLWRIELGMNGGDVLVVYNASSISAAAGLHVPYQTTIIDGLLHQDILCLGKRLDLKADVQRAFSPHQHSRHA